MKKLLSLIGSLALCIAAAAAQQTGTAGSAGELFVDVSAADYLQVVDLATRQIVDKIVVGMHPHGLAVTRRVVAGRAHDLLLVTVEETGELVVVDARSHKILARVAVGEKPNELTITRDGQFAYVPLQGESKVAIVELDIAPAPAAASPARSADAALDVKLTVVKKIAMGEWPHNSYTGQKSGRIYVTSFRGKKIHVFDPKMHEQLFEMDFPGEVRPVAFTRDESRAYVAMSDFHGFAIADMRNKKVLQRVALPDLPPGTPEPYLNTYVHGLTLSADERELWVTSCAGAAVYAYSLPDAKLLAKIPTGKFPHWFAWQDSAQYWFTYPATPKSKMKATRGALLWVSLMESNEVSAIDPLTRTVVATLPTGPAPKRIVVVPAR